MLFWTKCLPPLTPFVFGRQASSMPCVHLVRPVSCWTRILSYGTMYPRDLHRTSWRSFIGRISCRIFIQMLILCTHIAHLILPYSIGQCFLPTQRFLGLQMQRLQTLIPKLHWISCVRHLPPTIISRIWCLQSSVCSPCLQSSMDYPSALLWSFPNFFLPVKTGLHIFGASSSKCIKASTCIMSFAHAVQNVCKTLFHQPRRYCVSFLNYPIILMAYNDKKQRFRCFLSLESQ